MLIFVITVWSSRWLPESCVGCVAWRRAVSYCLYTHSLIKVRHGCLPFAGDSHQRQCHYKSPEVMVQAAKTKVPPQTKCCYHGGTPHDVARKCSIRGGTCNVCGVKGNYARVCKKTSTASADTSKSEARPVRIMEAAQHVPPGSTCSWAVLGQCFSRGGIRHMLGNPGHLGGSWATSC